MTGDTLEKLVAHPRWAQLMELEMSDGMVTQPDRYGRRFVWGNGHFPQISGPSGVRGICDKPPIDINHPATKGVLLHALREATDDGVYALPGRVVNRHGVYMVQAAGTEGAALAIALLAAWEQA